MADHLLRDQHRPRAGRRPGTTAPDACRAEDRIRSLKDSGLRNLPLHEFAKNIIWLELVQLASELLTWTQLLAFDGTTAKCWEPKRVRLRILNVAARLVRIARREWLQLPRGWPWTDLIVTGHARLHTLT